MRPSLIATHLVLAGSIALATTTGCRRSPSTEGLSDSTFVSVMAELRRAYEAPAADSAVRAARRDAILQRRGLTPAQLEAAARQLAENPARAQTVWQAIERRAGDSTVRD